MDLTALKLLLMLVMIICTIVMGLVPMKVLKYLRRWAAHAGSSSQHKHVSLVLCLLTCFSGGVFLATCFLHLFPELKESVDALPWKIDYPIAELLACSGFFLLFFLEEMVIILLPSFAHHSHSHGHSHAHPVSTESSPLAGAESGCCMTTGFMSPNGKGQHDHDDHHDHDKHSHHGSHDDDVHIPLKKSVESEEDATGHCRQHCPLTVHSRRLSAGASPMDCSTKTDCPEVFTALALAEPERCETNCEKVNEDPPILMKSSPHAHSHGVRSITFVLALSIHSLIEGLAFGVTGSTGDVWALFLSLMVHKLIVAFSVGLQLARTHAHQLHWVVMSICILAVMTPLGALIGMGVAGATFDPAVQSVVIALCQGLAVGTFLYVTFFEVLLHERDNEHPNLLKLLVIMIGFGMIGLLRLMDDGHGHSHAGAGGGHDEHEVAGAARALLGGHGHSHDDHHDH